MDSTVRRGTFFLRELFIIVSCCFNCILYVLTRPICLLVCCIFSFFHKLWKVLSDLFGDHFDEEGPASERNNVSTAAHTIGELRIETQDKNDTQGHREGRWNSSRNSESYKAGTRIHRLADVRRTYGNTRFRQSEKVAYHNQVRTGNFKNSITSLQLPLRRQRLFERRCPWSTSQITNKMRYMGNSSAFRCSDRMKGRNQVQAPPVEELYSGDVKWKPKNYSPASGQRWPCVRPGPVEGCRSEETLKRLVIKPRPAESWRLKGRSQMRVGNNYVFSCKDRNKAGLEMQPPAPPVDLFHEKRVSGADLKNAPLGESNISNCFKRNCLVSEDFWRRSKMLFWPFICVVNGMRDALAHLARKICAYGHRVVSGYYVKSRVKRPCPAGFTDDDECAPNSEIGKNLNQCRQREWKLLNLGALARLIREPFCLVVSASYRSLSGVFYGIKKLCTIVRTFCYVSKRQNQNLYVSVDCLHQVKEERQSETSRLRIEEPSEPRGAVKSGQVDMLNVSRGVLRSSLNEIVNCQASSNSDIYSDPLVRSPLQVSKTQDECLNNSPPVQRRRKTCSELFTDSKVKKEVIPPESKSETDTNPRKEENHSTSPPRLAAARSVVKSIPPITEKKVKSTRSRLTQEVPTQVETQDQEEKYHTGKLSRTRRRQKRQMLSDRVTKGALKKKEETQSTSPVHLTGNESFVAPTPPSEEKEVQTALSFSTQEGLTPDQEQKLSGSAQKRRLSDSVTEDMKTRKEVTQCTCPVHVVARKDVSTQTELISDKAEENAIPISTEAVPAYVKEEDDGQRLQGGGRECQALSASGTGVQITQCNAKSSLVEEYIDVNAQVSKGKRTKRGDKYKQLKSVRSKDARTTLLCSASSSEVSINVKRKARGDSPCNVELHTTEFATEEIGIPLSIEAVNANVETEDERPKLQGEVGECQVLSASGTGVRITHCNAKLLVTEEDTDDEPEMSTGKRTKRGDNCRKLMSKNPVTSFVCSGSSSAESINTKRKTRGDSPTCLELHSTEFVPEASAIPVPFKEVPAYVKTEDERKRLQGEVGECQVLSASGAGVQITQCNAKSALAEDYTDVEPQMSIGKRTKKGDGDSSSAELRDVKRKASDDTSSTLEPHANEVMLGKTCQPLSQATEKQVHDTEMVESVDSSLTDQEEPMEFIDGQDADTYKFGFASEDHQPPARKDFMEDTDVMETDQLIQECTKNQMETLEAYQQHAMQNPFGVVSDRMQAFHVQPLVEMETDFPAIPITPSFVQHKSALSGLKSFSFKNTLGQQKNVLKPIDRVQTVQEMETDHIHVPVIPCFAQQHAMEGNREPAQFTMAFGQKVDVKLPTCIDEEMPEENESVPEQETMETDQIPLDSCQPPDTAPGKTVNDKGPFASVVDNFWKETFGRSLTDGIPTVRAPPTLIDSLTDTTPESATPINNQNPQGIESTLGNELNLSSTEQQLSESSECDPISTRLLTMEQLQLVPAVSDNPDGSDSESDSESSNSSIVNLAQRILDDLEAENAERMKMQELQLVPDTSHTPDCSDSDEAEHGSEDEYELDSETIDKFLILDTAPEHVDLINKLITQKELSSDD